MNITKTTLKLQASFNYQVASLEVEIENCTEVELDNYANYLSDICSNHVKMLSEKVGPTHTNQDQKPVVQTQRSYRTAPANPSQNPPRYGSAPKNERTPQHYPGSGRSTSPSFAQINMLKKLGYSDEQLSVMTKYEATEIIRDYQVSTGYQQQDGHDIPDYNNY